MVIRVDDPTIPSCKALILLDEDGKRLAVKYYGDDWYVDTYLTENLIWC